MRESSQKIKDAIGECNTAADFLSAAENLLNALGYESTRKIKTFNQVKDFLNQFPANDTQSQQDFIAAAESVNIIRQFSESDIRQNRSRQSGSLIADNFNKGDYKSFIFVAVQLKKGGHNRSQYAQYTREINKRFKLPTVVLFLAADKEPDNNRLTIAFVGRREHKTDSNRDVLQKVSLLHEINCYEPHRGHVDILDELTLSKRLLWIDKHKKDYNFDGLLDAWLDELDTEALNKRFYNDLFVWFEQAVHKAKFPNTPNTTKEDNVIRLITRILFIWFIKEKGLVAEELFIEEQISPLLKNYDAQKGDTYYRAILQNLFFATLNTKIDDRKFSKQTQETHRDFNCYRYKSLMKESAKIKELMDKTPFINGGLFDCLDSFEGVTNDGVRIDCFTDNKTQGARLFVPNHLFFDENKGLITSILNKYKFTVEENTPIEQEVALDPELLGKVFENLLAAYNPETRDIARPNLRKQTGSYYTPREIVDYMADESLAAHLAAVCPQKNQQLHDLFDYAKPDSDFTTDESKQLIRAISQIKVFDPAVGSGSFPMSILNKLNLALAKLDSKNKEWRKLQKEKAAQDSAKAFDKKDSAAREKRLKDINNTFTRYSSAFGRKLFLIQNSIYGVDIQPVACQIAKLRFFISLAIEQTFDKNKKADNFGIRPLPNLETRFIAADTLIQISEEKQAKLTNPNLDNLEQQLNENRESHFNATTRKEKWDCRKKDKTLRMQLAAQLQKDGFQRNDAHKISSWNPYDQNAAADWFDSEYMFGVKDGFDVVIGNPPYVQLQKDAGRLADLYAHQKYDSFARSGDIYCLFYEQGHKLLSANGNLCYITSNKWMRAGYGGKLRDYLSQKTQPLKLLDLGPGIFDATVDTNILLLAKTKQAKTLKARTFNKGDGDFSKLKLHSMPTPQINDSWVIINNAEHELKRKIESQGTPLKDWDISINYGIKTGCNEAFIINQQQRDELIAKDPKSAEIIKPILRGRDIQRYRANWAELYLLYVHSNVKEYDYLAIRNHLLQFKTKLLNRRGGMNKKTDEVPYEWWQLQVDYHSSGTYKQFQKEKIIYPNMTKYLPFVLDNANYLTNQKCFIITGKHIKYLVAILNSALWKFAFSNNFPELQGGTRELSKIFFDKIPIKKTPTAAQRPFIKLADKIIAAKESAPAADTSKLEAEIDELVYKLYALTPKEIEIIRGRA